MAKDNKKKSVKKTEVLDADEKKIKLFDVLNMIEGQKLPWNKLSDDFKNVYSQFMINRFVSSYEVYVPIVAELTTRKLTDEQHYSILCQFVSGKWKHWFNNRAYKKEKLEENLDLLIFAVCHEYEIGVRDAKMYINNLKGDIKDKLREKWSESYKYERGK